MYVHTTCSMYMYMYVCTSMSCMYVQYVRFTFIHTCCMTKKCFFSTHIFPTGTPTCMNVYVHMYTYVMYMYVYTYMYHTCVRLPYMYNHTGTCMYVINTNTNKYTNTIYTIKLHVLKTDYRYTYRYTLILLHMTYIIHTTFYITYMHHDIIPYLLLREIRDQHSSSTGRCSNLNF